VKKVRVAKSAPPTVEDYLSGTPEPARGMLKKLRATIRAVVPREATEVISYRIPAFKYKGMLVWYAAFAKHCSLFPGSSVIEAFEDELKGYTISKGTVQFPLDKPLPTALVKKMVKAKIAENEGR
jgi:uncharacterized protein YdhG (YjbR/CyaY superfamily)